MLALLGATLIDGTGGPVIPDSAVLLNGQKIEDVGPRAAVALPPDVEVIDVSGMTLMPGLIDCHDHLASQGYDLAGRWGLSEPSSLQHLRQR